MARWDGPLFYGLLGDVAGRDVLEVGIGVGRVARQVLAQGCRRLTGLDISSKALEVAGIDLAAFPNLELVLADIGDFERRGAFDVAYSVLTFMHVEDKRQALRKVVSSLRPGGHVVLSISQQTDFLDFGDWAVRLFPWSPEQYADALADAGCRVAPLVPLVDSWIRPNGRKSDTYGSLVATLIKATRRNGV